jgi:nitrile hydratase accessory protein
MKGILNVGNARRRFVLQGVHMLLDGRPGAPWGLDEPRESHLVFIGKNLERDELERSFEACFEPIQQSLALSKGGYFEWEQFREALIESISTWERDHPLDDPSWSYYHHWLKALENVMAKAGVVDPSHLGAISPARLP